MKLSLLLFSLAAICAYSALAVNFYSPIQLCSSIVANRCFEGYLWSLDTPVNPSVSNETMLRMEIEVNPLDASQREVIVRRINRAVVGNRTVSSQLQFQLPFVAALGNPFDCCIHEAIGVTNTFVPSTEGTNFTIPRKDGFTIVKIVGPITAFTNTSQLASIILDNTSETSTWDMVNAICPVTCAVQSNYVVVIDGSISVNNNEFKSYAAFLNKFVDRVPISPNSANLGIVYYSGGHQFDRYCVTDSPPVSFTKSSNMSSPQALALWAQALGDPDWYTNVDWPTWSNGKGAYYGSLTYQYCFTQDKFLPALGTDSNPSCSGGSERGGAAYAMSYISEDESFIRDIITTLEQPSIPNKLCTGTGTGIHMAIDLFERAAIFRPTVPEIIIVLTDGEANTGERCINVTNVARSFGQKVFVVGIGSDTDLNYNQLIGMAGYDNSRYFRVTDFDQFDEILEPLLTSACLGESGTGAICPNCPTGSLCTTCSQCVTCISDADCNKCQRCNLNTRACNDLPLSASCPFDAPTTCDEWICDGVEGCILTRNDEAEAEFIASCNATEDGVWNATQCLCQIDVDTGDGGTPVGPIVGATVGATTVAAAATLATVVGGVAVCGLLALAAVAAIIAALIVLAVLAVGLLVLLVVGGLGIAALVMGIKMAIPPAIKGLEIANPADITAMENPLAKGAEWVGSKLEGE